MGTFYSRLRMYAEPLNTMEKMWCWIMSVPKYMREISQ